MNFQNARLLDYNRNHEFFDSDFRFGVKTSYQIEGYLLDLQNSIGVSGVMSSYEFFRTGLKDYQDILINGENFGKGRVSSFSVNESNFVQYTTYNIEINGFESGNIENLTGEYYSGFLDSFNQISPPHLLENFQESFDFQRSDDSYSYNHNLNIKYASGDNVLINPVDRAKALATYIYTQPNPAFGFIDNQTSGLYTGNFRNYFSENYDVINNTASFSKKFNSLNPSGSYSIALTQSIERNENGITNVLENASIKANVEPKKTILIDSVNLEISNSFPRCSGVYEEYRDSDSYELIRQPRVVNKSLNVFDGNGSYSVSYTNDPSFNLGYIWSFTQSLDRQNSFWEVTENGNVRGLGSSSFDKYQKALSGYSDVKTGIYYRSSGVYFGAGRTDEINLVLNNESKNQFDGTISYSQRFSDDKSRNVGGFRRLEISSEDLIPTDFYNTFEILGFREATQSIGTTTLGRRNLSLRGSAIRSDNLNDILDKVLPIANQNVPTGNDVHIADVNYSLNESTNNFSVNLVWNFNRSSRGSELL